MRVKDARGKEIFIKSRPMRIVSLAPSNTEILFALGLKNRIVGVTKYCDYPAEAKKKAKIGDMTVSAEAVVALKPDLVLAHATLNSTVISRLENMGLTVFAIDPKTIGEVARDVRTVGKITGMPRKAEQVSRGMERTIAGVKADSAKNAPKKVLVVVQNSPLWAAGPKTFVNEMIGFANAKNIAYDARPGFVTFSKEIAITRNPDVIIVGREEDVNYFMKSPEWRNTSAVKHKRIYVIDSDILFRAAPRLSDGLKELAARLAR